MWKTLHIENFQAHRETLLEFPDGVLAVIGLNNHGKSSIIRALLKVVRNEPEGTGFVTTGQKTCRIVLVTGESTITREVTPLAGTAGNRYGVNDLEFVGFGKGVPEEVVGAVGVTPPVSFGGVLHDLNFQKQSELWFLLSETPGGRSKILGKVMGDLDAISRVIQRCVTEGRALEAELRKAREEWRKTEEEIACLAWVDGAQGQLDVAGTLCDEINQLNEWCEWFGTTKKELIEIGFQITDLDKRIVAPEDFSTLSGKLQAGETICRTVREFERLVEEFRQVESSIGTLCGVETVLPLLTDVDTRLEKVRVSRESLVAFEQLIEEYRVVEQSIQQVETDIRCAVDAHGRCMERLEEVKTVLKVCPLCGKPF